MFFLSCPVTGHHWKEPVFVLFAPSLQMFIYIDEIPWNLLQAKQSEFSQLFLFCEVLQSLPYSCGALLNSQQYASGPRKGCSYTDVAPPLLDKGEDHLPRPVGNILPDIAQDIPVTFFAAREHFWLMFSLVVTRTSRCFSAKLSSPQISALYCFSPGAGICLFSFVVPATSSASGGPSGQPHNLYLTKCTTPPYVVSIVNFLRVCQKNSLALGFPTTECLLSTSRKNNLKIKMYCSKESLKSVYSEKDSKEILGSYILTI